MGGSVMDVKVRETSCCGAVLYCSTLVLVVLCLCGGPILLSKYAAPALRDYLQQERHHMTATCSFTNYTFTGDQPCTYKKHCGQSVCAQGDAYPCVQVNVTVTEETQEHTAMLFNSYQDALLGNYECSLYACGNGNQVITWLEDLATRGEFRCFYHPGNSSQVFLESASRWRVIVLFALALVLIFIGVWGLLVAVAAFTGCNKLFLALTCCMCCTTFSKTNRVWDRSVEERRGMLQALESADLARLFKLVTPLNANIRLYEKETFLIRTTTPLLFCASKGHLDILKHLVTLGADVNHKNDADQTLLHCACLSLKAEVVEHCLTTLNCGGMINQTDIFGCTPLILLAKVAKSECTNLVSIAQTLIQYGAGVSWRCMKNYTALHHAILNAQKNLVSLLIRHGCVDNDEQVDRSKTPLTALLLVKDGVNLRLLLEAGVDPRRDTQIQDVLNTASGLDPELLTLLRQELISPAPLSRMCRTVIRSSICAPNLHLGLEKLKLETGASLPIGIMRSLRLQDL